jgi:hypothetical protein
MLNQYRFCNLFRGQVPHSNSGTAALRTHSKLLEQGINFSPTFLGYYFSVKTVTVRERRAHQLALYLVPKSVLSFNNRHLPLNSWTRSLKPASPMASRTLQDLIRRPSYLPSRPTIVPAIPRTLRHSSTSSSTTASSPSSTYQKSRCIRSRRNTRHSDVRKLPQHTQPGRKQANEAGDVGFAQGANEKYQGR